MHKKKIVELESKLFMEADEKQKLNEFMELELQKLGVEDFGKGQTAPISSIEKVRLII